MKNKGNGKNMEVIKRPVSKKGAGLSQMACGKEKET